MKINFHKINCHTREKEGVALVITLILLSVITFMAVTFLVVSRRESEQVNTLSQQNNAKFAATIASDHAQSQIIAQMLATSNAYNFGLLVSTNFINPYYTNFNPNSITNVGYYDSTGNLLAGNTMAEMQNNLLILPRAPVFITTNRNQAIPEFRFYLDLNRNTNYDPNNTVMILTNDSGNLVTNVFTGDPEWVGILDHPDMRHSSSNFFIGRYAFIALPIGNSLDFNFMHNQVKQIGIANDGYLRNQGVGSWEINMAGLLYGINSNIWTYEDYEWNNSGASSRQFAFDDAASILQYRYNIGYTNLRAFGRLYGGQAASLVASGYIDYYSTGPLMTSLTPLTTPPNNPSLVANTSWSGDYNQNQLFTTQDLFNSGLGGFATHLQQLGTTTNSIDRYAFYNMLSQASFASAPEPYPYPYATKLNLNYANVGGTNATNFIPWTSVQFFTNAAIRLLRSRAEYTAANLCSNGTIYIPIYPTNFYTPSVHRMLQLAANIYDASTNKTGAAPIDFDYPSVFRPTFGKTGTGTNSIIYINGYTNVESVAANDPIFAQPTDLRRINDVNRFPTGSAPIATNVYGIPYIVGAKPGFPHFNSYSMVPIVNISRPMQIVANAVGSTNYALWHTNVYYTLAISNAQSVSCWYPATNTFYSRGVRIYATNEMTMALTVTNGLNQGLPGPPRQFQYLVGNLANSPNPYVLIGANTWAGSPSLPSFYTYGQSALNTNSFILPLQNVTNFISSGQLTQVPFNLTSSNTASFSFPVSTSYFVPKWAMTVTNRVRLIMLDDKSQRVIDYVQLGGLGQVAGLDSYEDINQELTNADRLVSGYPFWVTNAFSVSNAVPIGFYNQIAIATGQGSANGTVWQKTLGEDTGLVNFLAGKSPLLSKQVGYTANIIYTNNFTWSANDPLVHYTTTDLADLTQYALNASNLWQSVNLAGTPSTATTNGMAFNTLMWVQHHINTHRYQPWNVTNGLANRKTIMTNQLAYQDPLIYSSADWQFPTNRLPNIGWLGRVHRGTPWQTVYLKSTPITDANIANHTTVVNYPNGSTVTNVYANHVSWENWGGDNYCWPGNPHQSDASISEPTNDWKILDLFTTSPNENASRGQLSVNQTGSAAWAAILNGVFVVTNTSPTSFGSIPIDPYTNYNALSNIYAGINNQRSTYPGGVFTSVGDILSVSNLTVASPFLNTANTANLSDAAYERIPQQILSLLRVGTPRYVIYAYGQSLKPADHSIFQGSGQYFGMCTNYQITGEVVTRTVVRLEPANSGSLGYPFTSAMRPVVESFTVLPPE